MLAFRLRPYGLEVILGFIGARPVVHALHTDELPFVNGGAHVTAVPEIPTWLSLAVILATLLVPTVAGPAKGRRDRRRSVAAEG
jgi:tellurite resistance protein TerC